MNKWKILISLKFLIYVAYAVLLAYFFNKFETVGRDAQSFQNSIATSVGWEVRATTYSNGVADDARVMAEAMTIIVCLLILQLGLDFLLYRRFRKMNDVTVKSL